SVVCFRARTVKDSETDTERAARLDALNEQIMHAANSTGSIFISHTRLHDKFTLRLAVGNIRTTGEHVRRAWELLNETLQTNL
ncbi:MAG: amino acid decarboxylase, partial [Acidobacteria bacterium]|nr:amino acid decarboxylase [Acidobacteriota bacterium]